MPESQKQPRGACRLPPSARLKRSGDFARLRKQGRRVVSESLILNWLSKPQSGPARVGVVTGRRLGGAVARSRARRLLREAWRRNQHRLGPALDMVMVARPAILRKKLPEVERDFFAALRRAGILKSNETG